MSDTNWIEVKKDYEEGLGLTELSQKYGVKMNTIKGRQNREEWKRCIEDDFEEAINNAKGLLFDKDFIVPNFGKIENGSEEELAKLEDLTAIMYMVAMGKASNVKNIYKNGVKVEVIVESIPPSVDMARAFFDMYMILRMWKK
jgi:hypothetical protein